MSYVDVDGRKYVQLDDGEGVLVPCVVALSLEGGSLVRLTETQIQALKNPNWPTEYPLPASQVEALRSPYVEFPEAVMVENFPPSFEIDNFPSNYPLPADQIEIVQVIQTLLANFAKGAGMVDGNTLRLTIASDQSAVKTTIQGCSIAPIDQTQSGSPTEFTVRTPAAGKRLQIHNLVLSSASLITSLSLYQGTDAEGQSPISGTLQSVRHVSLDFPSPLELGLNKSFVIEFATLSTTALRGFYTYSEV